MRILAMDTTGGTCSAAYCEDGVLRSEIIKNIGLTHSQTLMPMIEEALCGRSVYEMDAIAVAIGPGSFTGVRIGVCTAKALAQAAGIKVACVDTLDALAKNISGFDGIVCPMLDARRGQVYAAAFRNGEKILNDIADDMSKVVKSLPQNERVIFLGDGAMLMKDEIYKIIPDALFAESGSMLQRASSVALVAEHDPDIFKLPKDVYPHYIRESQAQRVRREKLAENGI